MVDIINIRRDLHMIPEESLKEFKTKEYILSHIKKLSCDITEIKDTGLVAYFDNKAPTTIAIRCDMDALKIPEENDVVYKSKNEGLSHACGHDGHMAMLLGLAYYLDNNKNLKNNVLLIFQPAEENIEGANLIIKSGVLDKYKIKHVFGMHIWPDLDNNIVYTKPEELCALTSMINIEVVGKSVHVANSSDGIDALEIGSHFLSDIYKYEKTLDKSIFRLLKFGFLTSGGSWNIISDSTRVSGTLRTYSYEAFDKIKNDLLQIKTSYEKSYGCKINLEFSRPCLAVINDTSLANRFISENHAVRLKKAYLQGEDFGAYSQIIPSCFFLLGCGHDTKLHTKTFNFDESILNTGLNLYKKIVDMEF